MVLFLGLVSVHLLTREVNFRSLFGLDDVVHRMDSFLPISSSTRILQSCFDLPREGGLLDRCSFPCCKAIPLFIRYILRCWAPLRVPTQRPIFSSQVYRRVVADWRMANGHSLLQSKKDFQQVLASIAVL